MIHQKEHSFVPKLVRWALPSFLVAFGLAGQVALRPLVGGKIFILLYPAIFFGALFSGCLPGVFAVIFAVVGALYWIIPPFDSFAINTVGEVFGLVVFAITGTVANLLGSRIRTSRIKEHEAYRRAEEAKMSLQQKSEQLEILNQRLEQTVSERTRSLENEVVRRTSIEKALRLAQKVAHVGSFNWNIETGVNYWTPELEAIYGLPIGTFPKTQQAWERLVHPEDLSNAIQKVDMAFHTKDPVEGEWRVIWPNGNVRWISGRFQVIRDDAEKPIQLTGVNIDITDKKHAEEALKYLNENLEAKIQERTLAIEERDEKLRLALKSALTGTWDWSIETNKLTWDAAMCTIFGISPEHFKGTLESFLDLVHHEDREATNEKVQEAIEKDLDYEMEYRVIWPDKSTRYIHARGKGFKNKEGTPIRMIGICWDITEKKQSELARLKAEQKFRVVMEAAPDSILLVNSLGKITSVNEQTERLFGYSRSELLGQNVEMLVPKETQEKHFPLRDEFLKTAQTRPMAKGRELSALHKDGTLIPVEISLSPGKAEEEFFVMAVVRDITERKKAESQLSTLAAVVNFSNDFIGISNTDMSPIYLNEAGMHMVGLNSMEEVKKTRLLDYFWPEDRVTIEKEAIPMLTKTGRWSGLCRFRNFKTGEPIHTLWNAFLIKDAGGKPTAWGTVSPNLNVIKQSEDKIRTALAEKEVLLREIHHRVKNNLNVVSNLLGLQAHGIKDPKLSEAFRESRNRVVSMALIHEKLYQSQNLAEIDFELYVKDFIESLYHSYGLSRNQYEANLDIHGVKFDIETAIPCSLIINELVSNSLKYAFANRQHGRISIAVHPNATNEDWAYELVVGDDGVGMPDNFSIENSSSLGLKLVKTLTRQIGGDLELDAKHGTKFTIHFGKKTNSREGEYHVN